MISVYLKSSLTRGLAFVTLFFIRGLAFVTLFFIRGVVYLEGAI
jgi:hypothetical protein